MGSVRITVVLLLAATGVASADPPVRPPLVLSPFMLATDPAPAPTLPPVSLRLEAVRVATEQFDESWRYPIPGPAVGLDGNGWFVGVGHYHPRTARSAALHGGSIGATILGQVLVGSGSPLAGAGALLAGATLDAAAADADRDAEAAKH